MDLHGIQIPMSTLLHNSKNYLCVEKSHGLHDIKADILISNIIIQDGFFGLSWLEGKYHALGQWYIVKKYLLLKW